MTNSDQNAALDKEHVSRRGAAERPPKGGDKTTEDQLVADNAVEEDMIKALDPDNPSS